MPSQIQRVANGLLALLNIKATGENPRWLADVVQPTLDLGFLYGSDLLATTSSQNNVTAAGTILEIENGSGGNPVGVAWKLLAVGWTAEGFTVGGRAQIGITLQPPSGILVPIAPVGDFTATGVNDRYDYGFMVPQPVILMPGSKLRFIVQRDVGGAGSIDITARALAVPLQI